MRHATPLRLAAALFLVSTAACGGPHNPLIGKWTLIKGDDCPTKTVEFTSTTTTTYTEAIGPYPAEKATANVTYNMEDPKQIWVIGSAGITHAYYYQFEDDPNQMVLNGGDCVYKRQS